MAVHASREPLSECWKSAPASAGTCLLVQLFDSTKVCIAFVNLHDAITCRYRACASDCSRELLQGLGRCSPSLHPTAKLVEVGRSSLASPLLQLSVSAATAKAHPESNYAGMLCRTATTQRACTSLSFCQLFHAGICRQNQCPSCQEAEDWGDGGCKWPHTMLRYGISSRRPHVGLLLIRRLSPYCLVPSA